MLFSHLIRRDLNIYHTPCRASQVALVVKNPLTNAGDIRDMGSVPGWGRSPEGGHGNPLQYSCLENPRRMDRRAWWATYRQWVCKELDTTEWLTLSTFMITSKWRSNSKSSPKICICQSETLWRFTFSHMNLAYLWTPRTQSSVKYSVVCPDCQFTEFRALALGSTCWYSGQLSPKWSQWDCVLADLSVNEIPGAEISSRFSLLVWCCVALERVSLNDVHGRQDKEAVGHFPR